MIARLGRSLGGSTLACLAGTALVMVVIQAVSGEWSLHNTLDLGGTLVVLVAVVTAVTCLPIFALLRRSAVLSTQGRAAFVGAGSAALAGVVTVAWFFGDGFYPEDMGDLLRVVATPFFVPFPIAGTAFGYVWSARGYSK